MSGRFRVVSEGDGWWTIQSQSFLGRWTDVETDMNATASALDRFDTIEKARAFVKSQCDQPAADLRRRREDETGSKNGGGK